MNQITNPFISFQSNVNALGDRIEEFKQESGGDEGLDTLKEFISMGGKMRTMISKLPPGMQHELEKRIPTKDDLQDSSSKLAGFRKRKSTIQTEMVQFDNQVQKSGHDLAKCLGIIRSTSKKLKTMIKFGTELSTVVATTDRCNALDFSSDEDDMDEEEEKEEESPLTASCQSTQSITPHQPSESITATPPTTPQQPSGSITTTTTVSPSSQTRIIPPAPSSTAKEFASLFTEVFKINTIVELDHCRCFNTTSKVGGYVFPPMKRFLKTHFSKDELEFFTFRTYRGVEDGKPAFVVQLIDGTVIGVGKKDLETRVEKYLVEIKKKVKSFQSNVAIPNVDMMSMIREVESSPSI